MKLHHSLFPAALLMAIGAGCSSTSDLVDNGKAVAQVEVSPDKDTMSMGTTLQLHAVLRYADAAGSTRDVSNDPHTEWTTSDAEIATVSKDGQVTTLKQGIVDILADYKGEGGNAHFAITP